MKLRNVARWCAVAGLTVTLAGAAPALSATDPRLPRCGPGAASTVPPSGPAGPETPGACRAVGRILESGVRLARRGEAGFTPIGYHHLGANTGGEWSGVSGRISVVDGSVRPGTYDFVAGRFMAKRTMGRGGIAWLEAGWAETGWAGAGRQHIYTFNTNTKTWQFYDQYALKPGDRVWIDLHSDADGMWGAWLWWNNRWNLLTAQPLPIGSSAFIEQYVEVHVDAGRPARLMVPEVSVDNVRLRPPGGGESRFWRADVPTLIGAGAGAGQQRSGGFCLTWINQYDTWTAGDCPDDTGGLGGGVLAPGAEPLPAGDADVVGGSTAAADGSGAPTEPDPPAGISTAPTPQAPGALVPDGSARSASETPGTSPHATVPSGTPAPSGTESVEPGPPALPDAEHPSPRSHSGREPVLGGLLG